MDFWNDAWVHSLPTFKLLSNKPANGSFQTVADAISASTGKWDLAKLALEVTQEDLEPNKTIPLPLIDRE